MQLSKLVEKYTGNMAAKTAENGGIKTGTLQTDLQSLKAGNVFEGTVDTVKNNQVSLALGNGTSITARLSAGVSLTEGQSMFFLVKSNDGSTIEIKPYLKNEIINPTLTNALSQAGLLVSTQNLEMVNEMMERSLPVDKQSVSDMAKFLINHPALDTKDAALMKNLGIPFTSEMANQYQNYKSGEKSIVNRMEELFLNVSELFNDEGMGANALLARNDAVLKGILENGRENISNTKGMAVGLSEATISASDTGSTLESQIGTTGMGTESAKGEQIGIGAESLKENPGDTDTIQSGQSIGFSEDLKTQAEKLFGKAQTETLFQTADGEKTLLQNMREALSNASDLDAKTLRDFLQSKEYGKLLESVTKEGWLLEPEEGFSKEKVEKSYDSLEHMLTKLESELKKTGVESSAFTKGLSEIHQNLQFMEDLNHTIQYIQLPLKMSGQSTTGELYVYTNKRSIKEEDGTLSAFLHLDMTHLGATDVSVKMQGKSVDTKFYMEDDASYALVMNHIGELKKRIENKGYHCTISLSADADSCKAPFLAEMQAEDKAGHMLHRYSFDVKA